MIDTSIKTGNQITASIVFYFKGKKISAETTLNLDKLMQSNGKLPKIHPMLARKINLDFYSYEYEMMHAEAVCFSNAIGMVGDFVQGDTLDVKAFESAWKEQQVIQQLQIIASQQLAVDDLAQQTNLKTALLKAYQLGKEAKEDN